MALTIKTFVVLFLCLVSSLSAVTTIADDRISQALESRDSSVRVNVSSPVIRASGTLQEFTGELLLDQNNLANSSLTLQADLSRLRFESLPPEQMIMMLGLIHSLKDSKVYFRSKLIKSVPGGLKIEGVTAFKGKEKPASFVIPTPVF